MYKVHFKQSPPAIYTLNKKDVDSTILDTDSVKDHLTKDEIAYAGKLKSPKRQWEYLFSRWLIKQFGPFKTGDHHHHGKNSISWSDQYLTSLSHKNGVIAFSFCEKTKDKICHLGIDLECYKNFNLAIAPKVLLQEETKLFESQYTQDMSYQYYATLCFAVKEAVYKAYYPVVQDFFGFECFSIQSIDTRRCKVTGVITRDILTNGSNDIALSSQQKIYADYLDLKEEKLLLVRIFMNDQENII